MSQNEQKAEVRCITSEDMHIKCQTCEETRRKSLRFEVEAQEGKLTLDDLMQKISKIADN